MSAHFSTPIPYLTNPEAASRKLRPMRHAILIVGFALGCGGGGGSPDADPSAPDATGPSAPDAAPSAGCSQGAPTGVINGTITVGGVERTYILVVPADYDADTRYPLIFAWHGRTGTSTTARQYFGIEAQADGDAVIVYPQGLSVSGDPGDTGWELTEGGRDVALFDALLAQIQDSHCVGSVYSMGHSFGGYMSNALACFRGGQGAGDVRAIASIAGGGPFGACGGDPVSAVIIHGSADSVVPYSQGEASRDTWIGEAGCDPSGSPVEPSPCVAYDGCTSPLVVQWCSHDDTAFGGHGWPAFAAPAAWALFQASF
jgi:poly(3-hydroxybutyrate) depolymerase